MLTTGELISVKPSLLSWLPHLFAINERVVLHGNYGSGEMITTVAVGATNVGSIVIYDDRVNPQCCLLLKVFNCTQFSFLLQPLTFR